MTRGPSQSLLNRHRVPSFVDRVRESEGGDLVSTGLEVLQVNTGLLCNQECVHCHVESSPRRREQMEWSTMESVIRLAGACGCQLVDITGGAPELHPEFRRFVTSLREQGHDVQVRTNLTVLTLPKMQDLPELFRELGVRLVASLPCYLEDNVEKQRGEGVFSKSIEAIRALNAVGFGVDPELQLNLVYNPVGAHLPPPQDSLEEDYRRELLDRYGIRFTRLHTITNMPIGRFLDDLEEQGRDGEYLELLSGAFNAGTLPALMCRDQVSVRWDGRLFDCDFNLALDLPVAGEGGRFLDEIDIETFARRRIVTAGHCYGCTAGAGSSCGGALV